MAKNIYKKAEGDSVLV